MKKTKFGSVSHLNHELSRIDIQKMLLEKAKATVLSTAVELLEQDMLTLCEEGFARKVSELCSDKWRGHVQIHPKSQKYSILS